MAIDPDMKQVTKEIDRLLRLRRPDRYVVRDSVERDDEADLDVEDFADSPDTSWLDDIAKDVEDMIPEAAIRLLLARKIVGQREGRATTTANSLLRQIARTGQLVLGWYEQKDDPVAVIERRTGDGAKGLRESRVALRAMTPEDFHRFAIEERRRAGQDFSARNDACSGAEWIADQMARAGARRFDTWAMAEAPE